MEIKIFENKKVIFWTFFTALTLFCVYLIIEKRNEITLQGEIFMEKVEIFAKADGTIERIVVKEGDKVQKNDVIAILNLPQKNLGQGEIILQEKIAQNKIYQEEMQKAKANAARVQIELAREKEKKAKENYDYAQLMLKRKVLDEKAVNEARAQYEKTQNELKAAQGGLLMVAAASALSDEEIKYNPNILEIRTGENGEIAKINAKTGEFVRSGTSIATLNLADKLFAEFILREDLLSKFQEGKTFKGQIPALGKKKIDFMTTHIAPQNKMTTYEKNMPKTNLELKSFVLRAIPLGKNENIKDEMSVFVKWNKI